MKHVNTFRKIKWAIKNAQRNKSPYYSSLESLGFSISYNGTYSWNRVYVLEQFIRVLHKLSPKRRRSIMRVGRAAVRKNTTIDIKHLLANINGDLRYILFVKETNERIAVFNLKNAIEAAQKSLSNAQIVDAFNALISK